jgi:hypothetical protein
MEVRGTPTPLLEDVAGNPQFGGGQYDVSRNGTFVYLSGISPNARWPERASQRGIDSFAELKLARVNVGTGSGKDYE